ncbi:MAG: molybdopterin-dependent oxidoreductase [Moraxellaceae bacterium]|nr:molybdopterin-dependent oxidoreductase [Moraxellaceae bacterium]
MIRLPLSDLSPAAVAVATTCPYCGVGCGVTATVTDVAARAVDIAGDAAHPANFGRLCVKGSSLGETVHMEGRLLYPEIRGQRASWDDALSLVSGEFARIVREHGPDAVAFYVSGQLLTEDYYVANKLMKGFIGSANIDTNSRLCMSSSVAGHKRAFGSDTVPGSYEDFELADLVVITGSNTAWCHPILFQRLKAAKETRPAMRIVVIDPRRTATCDIADLHLPVKAGEDVRLFNGLLAYLASHGVLDESFIAAHTAGFAEALLAANTQDNRPARLAAEIGVDALDIERFFSWFTTTENTLTLYSQGVNQSSAGADKVNAILNCHLATGRIGKPGSGPFSLTGQPNAMGGREVGGLANMLAAHMDIENSIHRERVQRFWNAPAVAAKPGLKAVDMFEAVHSGKIKAIWIMATNPVVSMPDADRVRAALEKCELVVVSDCIADTDTTRMAHVKLPALAWGEKDGTVTNSERRISRQRAFLPAPGEARPDWWAMAEVGRRMGFADAFAFASAAEVFREHAALSAFENDEVFGLRDFDIGAFAAVTETDYNALAPVQWPVSAGGISRARLFADGRFFTPDQRALFMAVTARAPVNAPDADYPLVLNTGRIRDQWHTMTRTGLAPRLLQHIGEPFCALHPDDAAALGIAEKAVVTLESRWGLARARVQITTDQTPGSVFMPMHWTGVLTSSSRVGAVVNPATDPVSGQPELKHTPVRVRHFEAAWQGFVLSTEPLPLPSADYAVAVRGGKFWRFELAGEHSPASLPELANELLCTPVVNPENPSLTEMLEYVDAARGVYRRAVVAEGRLQSVCFLGPDAGLPERSWLSGLIGKELAALERRALLSGRPSDPAADTGRIICACFSVGEKTIRQAITAQQLDSVAAIGLCLKAGTNCGSCQPELKQILASCRDAVATNPIEATATTASPDTAAEKEKAHAV